jgi:hypothetical protein
MSSKNRSMGDLPFRIPLVYANYRNAPIPGVDPPGNTFIL